LCPQPAVSEVEAMLAEDLDYVVGVDPHRDRHALAVVAAHTGALVFEATIAASAAGYRQALKLAERHAPGRPPGAGEGAGSYGAGIARSLAAAGEQVHEVGRLPRERRGQAKTDRLDALRAARSVLGQTRPARPRGGPGQDGLRALLVARES